MTTDERDRLDQLERENERLKRALAQLTRGVDWSRQRGGRDARELRAICREDDAAAEAETRDQRRRALQAEFADELDAA